MRIDVLRYGCNAEVQLVRSGSHKPTYNYRAYLGTVLLSGGSLQYSLDYDQAHSTSSMGATRTAYGGSGCYTYL